MKKKVCSVVAWCFYLGFRSFVIYLEVLHYDALALALLHLEELNVGEPCLGVAIFGGFGGV